jgi:hypothetical protein
MSDTAQGPGWWIASDGLWYPPEQHPDAPADEASPTAQTPSEELPIQQPSAEQRYVEQAPMEPSPIEQRPFIEQPPATEPHMQEPPMQQAYVEETQSPPAGQTAGGAEQFAAPATGGWDSAAGMDGAGAPEPYSPPTYAEAPAAGTGAGARHAGKKRGFFSMFRRGSKS